MRNTFLVFFIIFTLNISDSHAYVGGTQASPSDFPSTVALPSLECGGAKIGKRLFITAAHCLATRGPISILKKGDETVILSGTERSNYSEARVRIKDVFIHPTYMDKIGKTMDPNLTVGTRGVIDVAIISIHEDTPKIKTGSLTLSPVALKSTVTVGGFGCESYDVPIEEINANYINQDVRYKIAKKAVSKVSPTYVSVPNNDLGSKAKSNGCTGDSGGPAYDVKGGVIGVNSFVQNSGLSFTRFDTPSVSAWLKSLIK